MDTKWEHCERFADLMLERRGFHPFFTETDDGESEDCTKMFINQEDHKLLIWFFKNDKMNIDSIKDFVKLLQSKKIDHGILIYQLTITSSTRKVIDNLYQFKIELFELKELQYDITHFKYYCRHEKVSPENALEIKKKFGTSLPSLLRNDPIVRYFSFQKGDIIRVYRRNDTIVYRLVK